MAEEEQIQKNEYEMKKEEQSREEASRLFRKRMKRIGIWLVGIGITASIVFLGFQWLRGLAPKTLDMSKEFADLGQDHIAVGASHEPYNSNPPTSGPHYVEWAVEKFYNKEIPDSYLVHNLEHGDIWISYNSRIPADVKERLKKFAGAKVVITARSANEFDISLAAWTHLDSFNIENNTLDEARIRDFIKRYVNRGPELIRGAAMGGKEF